MRNPLTGRNYFLFKSSVLETSAYLEQVFLQKKEKREKPISSTSAEYFFF